jgi:hypothetical protein
VAADVKAAIGDGFLVEDVLYMPNMASTPHFGKNKDGQASLTFGLTRATDGERFTFKWIGDAVPHVLLELAVKHDEGARAPQATVALEFDAAEVYETNEARDRKPRGRHDVDPFTGKPHPRPERLNGHRGGAYRYDRVGRCDLEAEEAVAEAG